MSRFDPPPKYESVEDLADRLADWLGIYDDKRCEYRDNDWHHVDGCDCRVFWVPAMAERIRRAYEFERRMLGAAN